MLHIMKLSVIAVALRHPELMTSRVTQAEDPFTHVGVNRPGPPMLPTAQTVSEGFGVATDYSNNPSPNKSYDTIGKSTYFLWGVVMPCCTLVF